ncbi:hypothetical protein [Pedobacter sp. JY14-1]|uniref:hypothetical protein n=1 Tax=Pedobacter sp. JY14-1 TaxID=3034151 RepID=UPI0023E10CDB|nr:hypothetical protein [Pedobacter sp. JY14-1]
MKRLLLRSQLLSLKGIFIFILLGFCKITSAQITGSFTVGGDASRYYPVTFSDGGWANNVASELEIGRSSVYVSSTWVGSVIARFDYHTTRWGNANAFIDAKVFQRVNGSAGQDVPFIGGWRDATAANADDKIVIWLKGGNINYYYRSKFAITVTVYDGTANALPYQESGGPSHTYKTVVDGYVNSNGISQTGSAYFQGTTNNYFNGNVGIGALDTKGYKLAVAGSMIAESVKVKLQGAWPDYVFTKGYKLPTLTETETHIKENGHLPGIPSASEVKENGVELGEMNKKLLQKIEELTLHLIEMEKEVKSQRKEINSLKQK